MNFLLFIGWSEEETQNKIALLLKSNAFLFLKTFFKKQTILLSKNSFFKLDSKLSKNFSF
jgi:hypothetical protein